MRIVNFTLHIRNLESWSYDMSPPLPPLSLWQNLSNFSYLEIKDFFTWNLKLLLCIFVTIFKKTTEYVKKSVISGVSDAKLYFFLCNSLVDRLYGVFSIFFGNSLFFWYSYGTKKLREPFFLSKSKVQKSKNVNIHKFVLRKFTVFSSGLIFKDKLFFNALQVSTEQRIFIILK